MEMAGDSWRVRSQAMMTVRDKKDDSDLRRTAPLMAVHIRPKWKERDRRAIENVRPRLLPSTD